VPVRTKHDRLVVDNRLIHAANRVGYPLKTIREVGAASAQDLNLLALFPGEDAEAIVLDFVQPSWSDGRAIHERGFARADEPRRRAPSQPGEGVRQDTVFDAGSRLNGRRRLAPARASL
jgi:hypothetical protein